MPTVLNPLLRRERFKLGFFGSNCSGGLSVTRARERWDASWEANLQLARIGDAAGMDFMLPIARWIGFPGEEINFMGSVLETTTWAAALLASTQSIAVITTVHTAVNNPVVVAKQVATLDHVGRGRAGLNIVAGWFKPEYEALGLELPSEHTARYAYAQEWFDVILKLWREKDPFDWQGEHFGLKNVSSEPKPLRRTVPILNAAGSGDGRRFAVRNADILFTPAVDLDRSEAEIAEIKVAAAEAGRELDVFTFSQVVCRPTAAEARSYYDGYVGQTDWAAVDYLMGLQFANAKSFPHDLLATLRERMAAGHGGYPLTGSPEDVADGIERLAKAGFGGTTLSFVNYLDEFPYFAETVLPILEARGVRTVKPTDASSA